MNSLSFILQYLTKPRTVGAILPSSKYLAAKMIQSIDFENAECIAEYGPGTGVFTEKILQRRKPGTVVLLFERNAEFCDMLSKKYAGEADFFIINDSAASIGEHMQKHGINGADYVVSGLPFASLPPAVSQSILEQTKRWLKQGGGFITFQYTLLRKDFIAQFFPEISVKRELRNVPPAYVFLCRE